MTETNRCPHCGALNRAEAEWCGQCYESLREPEPEPEPEPTPAETTQVATVAEAGPGEVDPSGSLPPAPPSGEGTPPKIPESAIGTQRGVFKVTDAGIKWKCQRCEEENPLDATICLVCGAPFAESIKPPVERVQRDPGTAALVSLFLPGAGHAYLGMWGQAVARGVLSLWAVFVVVISLFQRGQSGSTTMAVVFGAIATALWAITAHDAFREARFEEKEVLLKGRAFLYVVLGMLMLLMIMLTATGLSARN